MQMNMTLKLIAAQSGYKAASFLQPLPKLLSDFKNQTKLEGVQNPE